jgi:glycosyltransferase involved in cell wall biosynthesis
VPLNIDASTAMRANDMNSDHDRKLLGILVTYRRPSELSTMLHSLASQDRQLDHLVVVDNDPVAGNEGIVRRSYPDRDALEYIPALENLGPAGGIALGMRRVLELAKDRDWILLVDDDNPPHSETLIGDLERFGASMLAKDALTAGVGRVGARFDWRRARLVAMSRIAEGRLDNAVSVDAIGSGHFPLYLTAAVKAVGPFATELFFGADDVEYGLRLRKAGYSLYADSSLWRQARELDGRIGLDARPSIRLSEPSWRRYYELRNLIHILRSFGCTRTALRISLVRGIAKPLANLAVGPQASLKHLKMNLRACRDGWTGRLGRTLEPDLTAERREGEVA